MNDSCSAVPGESAGQPAPVDMPQQITRQWFETRQGQLCIGGIPLAQIAERYGTPAFVYDQSVLARKWAAIRNTLPERFHVHYSIKANPHQQILRFFLERGCGLEVASAGELAQALAADCPADQILFAGPGKTDAELRAALSSCVGEIHVESREEIGRLAKLARELGARPRIALRVNPLAAAEGGAMRMGGRPAPFGIDEEQLEDALDYACQFANLHVTGIHLFVGTQVLEVPVLLAQYRHALAIARRVADRLERPLETIDFGGGWGVPYFPHEQPLDLSELHAGLQCLVEEIDSDPRLRTARLIVEPGRFLTAEAGIYVTRVTGVKRSRGTMYVIVDGGMHHHLAASGNLGQVIKRNYPIAAVTRMAEPPGPSVELVGPLCTPLDTVGRKLTLPVVEPGDLLGVFLSGAYARAASPLDFLSHPRPPEVWISGGEAQLIRRRGVTDDFLTDQITCDPQPELVPWEAAS